MNQEQGPIPVVPSESRPLDEVLLDRFVEHVTGQEYTAEEITRAYEVLWGVAAEDAEGTDERIDTLVSYMRALIKEGLAENAFAGVIGTLSTLEQEPSRYQAFVEDMRVDERGRHVLQSIVSQKRRGTLTLGYAHAGKKHELRAVIDPARTPHVTLDDGSASTPVPKVGVRAQGQVFARSMLELLYEFYQIVPEGVQVEASFEAA